MPESDVRWRYTGDGSEFHNRIPARDLTDEDLHLLDDEQRALLKSSRLYEAVKAAAPRKEGGDS